MINCECLLRGAQHNWAQHVTVGMSTEQRNHKKHTFSWLSKGDPVQVRNEQAAGMSSKELASFGVGPTPAAAPVLTAAPFAGGSAHCCTLRRTPGSNVAHIRAR